MTIISKVKLQFLPKLVLMHLSLKCLKFLKLFNLRLGTDRWIQSMWRILSRESRLEIFKEYNSN